MAALGACERSALIGDVKLLGRCDLAAVPQVTAIGGQVRRVARDKDLIGGLPLVPGGGDAGGESPTQPGPGFVDTERRSTILAAQIDRCDSALGP